MLRWTKMIIATSIPVRTPMMVRKIELPVAKPMATKTAMVSAQLPQM